MPRLTELEQQVVRLQDGREVRALQEKVVMLENSLQQAQQDTFELLRYELSILAND